MTNLKRTWESSPPSIKSVLGGLLSMLLFWAVRFLIDTQDFINDLAEEITLGIGLAFGIGITAYLHYRLHKRPPKQQGDI